MKTSQIRLLCLALPLSLTSIFAPTSRADLIGYWPFDEFEGGIIPNLAGPDGQLFGNASWFTDPQRGQVLRFNDGGTGGYADLGEATIPQLALDDDFTWSFWANNVTNGTTATILGNRYKYNTTNVEWSPREFIKFTNEKFEYHVGGAGQDLNYEDLTDLTVGTWHHHLVVKDGDRLTYFRDGLFRESRTLTAGTQNAHPLYVGGHYTVESWSGSVDDVAIWTDALPLSAIAQIVRGTATPATVSLTPPTFHHVFSDNFNDETIDTSKWYASTRGLENNGFAGYDDPVITDGKLVLGGKALAQYWFGSSLETLDTFDSTKETIVSVDRVSISGGYDGEPVPPDGGRFRSSIWILGDDTHYLHFGQVIGEGGWRWNARDEGGLGTLLPTGSGNDIVALNPFDSDLGQHTLGIRIVPTGNPNEVFMHMLFDGSIVASHLFTNFPDTFRVILSAQGRQENDFVTAEFDNLTILQVPEPGSGLLAGLGLATLGLMRRRKATGQ